VPTRDAQLLARDLGLDLVEVAPMERPPVCRIMDYGKHKYNQKKRQKQSTAHAIVMKEIRLRPKTDDHDRMIKLKHAREFLQKGHKVQFTMLFRGRERYLRDYAREKFDDVLRELGDTIKIERPPAQDGRRMTMVVAPATAGATAGSGPKATGQSPAPSPRVAPQSSAPSGTQPTAQPAPQHAGQPTTQPTAQPVERLSGVAEGA